MATAPERIAVVSDAWFPQVNGVVRTLSTVRDELTRLGHAVTMITPDAFSTIPCPTYPEIRLALWPWQGVREAIETARPQAIHIATEGPLGHAARNYCLKRDLPFTTAYHTRFPEYVKPRLGIPLSWTYSILRDFHRPSRGIMVATDSIKRDLEARRFAAVKDWSRGVDTELFRPRDKNEPDLAPDLPADLPRPIFTFVGRVAVEKSIPDFLALDLPGSKVVIGDGPLLPDLRRRFPEAVFLGAKRGDDLARHFASGDVFVFPSRTDTYGLVTLEALACGLPVAALPVPGPIDVLRDPKVAVLDEDLGRAARAALELDAADCRAFALGFSWEACARQFLSNLEPFDRFGH